MSQRIKRPAAHFVDLDQIGHLSDTAWDLSSIDRRAYGNALRVQVQITTGLRIEELHNLRPIDLRPDGTVSVRMGKGSKPRTTVFLDGRHESQTLALLRAYIDGENRCGAVPVRPQGIIWTSGEAAYSHWVTHRLGPASGLQRRIPCLNAPHPDFIGPVKKQPPRYLIHSHLFRACFVILARRLPRRLSRNPVQWETIAHWLGHDSSDTTRGHYWYADEDENLEELAAAIPASLAPRLRIPEPRYDPRGGR